METATPSFTGFINTGPSIDATQAYFGFRWTGSSTSAPRYDSYHGRLVAVNKDTWQVAWERDIPLLGNSHNRSWINITPIIWQSAHNPTHRRIIVGDARAGLTAFTPTGDLGPLFLTTSAHAPVPCTEIESTSPAHTPSFTHASQTLLTTQPYTTPLGSGQEWHNTQGAATEMSIHSGRLFAGYNHATASESSLVIFRPAANIAVGQPTVLRLAADGTTSPLGTTPVRGGQRLRVTAPVTYEGDPLKGPVTLPVWAGFHSSPAPDVQTITLAPFSTGQVSFDLTVPTGSGPLVLHLVANPALYGARRAAEVSRPLPPGVTSPPSALPAAWGGGPITQGEAWALDNARTLAIARGGQDDPQVIGLRAPESVLQGREFGVQIVIAYLNNVGKANATVRGQVYARPSPDADTSDIPWGEAVINQGCCYEESFTFELWELGDWELVVEIDYPHDTNHSNNRRTMPIRVIAPTTRTAPGTGSNLNN